MDEKDKSRRQLENLDSEVFGPGWEEKGVRMEKKCCLITNALGPHNPTHDYWGIPSPRTSIPTQGEKLENDWTDSTNETVEHRTVRESRLKRGHSGHLGIGGRKGAGRKPNFRRKTM